MDTRLAPEDRARQAWTFVSGMDVGVVEECVLSRSGRPGAPAISPRLLMVLWFCACPDGVGIAGEMAPLCDEHMAYRWPCGRVGINHRTLSDFRGHLGTILDGLLSDMIAALVRAGAADGSTVDSR